MRIQTLIKEQQYSRQLHGLTQAALAINATLSVEQVLQVITEQAYQIIGTHQSVTSLSIDQNWAQAINAVYLSDKYAQWQDYNDQPDGSGIYACVCHFNRSMRMTQVELEAHPKWKGFGEAADRHPPMRGWLVAPLVGRDGRNIGLIQLSDKYEGEFTEEDEAILVQLAQMASVAVENTRLYEAQQLARTQAESANRIKDEFLAVLSHELRSPLNPILGWTRLLRERKLDEKATDRALATIERNAKLQTQLIEDLLDVSRILQGKLSLNVCPVNLPSIIKAAMETVRLAAEAKSIEIQMRFKPGIGQVSGDSTRLQQVVWNLLSNAVKFTPMGGQIEITLEQIGSEAQIQVSDTGTGISPDFLPHVFEYFRQADSTTTRKFGGLGLGLAIVRQLVELHGGTVAVDSPGEGQGAIFTVRLPLRRESATPKDEAATTNSCTTVSDTLPLANIRVLIVDDEADSRDFLAFVLEQAGAEVTAAASASAALQILSQSKQDILISDIGMPEMDGYMFMRQVRSLESEQENNIPAIALTAYAGEINQQQALAAGFQRHITKPVAPETLVQEIENMVSCI
ncbi:ATP-binding protein [Microcoleus sp. LAD1_D3]